MPKIYLIDGMSLVYRAYHVMERANFRNPAGMPTGAIFGFTNILTSFLEKQNPEYLLVAFDTQEPTFRHIQFENYKANRPEFPEELALQLPKIKKLLDLLGIPRFEKPGFEADDIIGTLAKKFSMLGNEVYCLTSDKDFYQLIDENIMIIKPKGRNDEEFDIVSFDQVQEKFGVTPDKVIDVLAIIGDAVDNVPGVKGIGEKTAIPLIQQFHTLENLYNNLDKIDKASIREKLAQYKNEAFLSKQLVTIDTNMPIDLSIDDLKRKPIDYKELDDFFKELAFTRIRAFWQEKARLEGSKNLYENNIKELPKEISQSTNYIQINNIQELDNLINELNSTNSFAFEIIYSSNDRQNNEMLALAIAYNKYSAYFIKFSNVKNENQLFSYDTTNVKDNTHLSSEIVLDKLNTIFSNPNIQKIADNLKYHNFVLKRYGSEIKGNLFDPVIASYLLNPDDNHSIDAISQKWIDKDLPVSFNFQNNNKSNSTFIDYNLVCEKTVYLLQLADILESELDKNNLLKLANEIEFPLISVLTDMEYTGVAIDVKNLRESSEQIDTDLARLQKEIYRLAGMEFNIDSPKQLGSVLFEKLNLPIIKKTKTGYSTDMGVLTELTGADPIINLIIDYRQLAKLKSTYIDALPKLVNPQTHKIHTTYNQTIAATGRLSSTDPNLQNIPVRSELGREIRKAFVASNPDGLLISADYSQIELRVMAYFSQDPNLIQAFKEGKDIHAATAAKLFSIDIGKVDSEMRRTAKTVNFGIMYGLGPYGLSQRLRIPKKDAETIISNYFNQFPNIKKYIDNTIESTRKKGYAETMLGRRRYFTDISSKNSNIRSAAERAAINHPIQGTAADMIKIAMINIYNELNRLNFKSKMILQIHDELLFDAIVNETEELKQVINKLMSNALPLGDIPISVDIGVGKNWFDAH
ncbi:MAG: DNA polymerase I [Candidatus Kapabacteria bacterium]|nr:DNA polymerase I [Candidatus Kapabacteria bacterium]